MSLTQRLEMPLVHSRPNSIGPPPTFLQASPYQDILLDLRSLRGAHEKIAMALCSLRPTAPDFLDLNYPVAFNFDQCFKELNVKASLYAVVFRSTVARSAVSSELFETLHRQDHESYLEAVHEVGGLLKYWFGSIDSERRNLATCLWTDESHAKKASQLPQHKKAVDLVRRGVYEKWEIQRYAIHLDGGKVTFVSLR